MFIFFHLNTISESTYNYMLSYFIFSDLDKERTEKIVLSVFSSSDYLSFSTKFLKNLIIWLRQTFSYSPNWLFFPQLIYHIWNNSIPNWKCFIIILFRKKLNKGFFSFSDEHCAPPIESSTHFIQSSSMKSRQMGCGNYITCILPRQHFQAWL